MKIRIARESDIDAMHRVRVAVRENRLADPNSIRREDYLTMLTRDGRGWVAEEEGRIVGFAIVDLSRENIWALFVDPEFEAQRIGRALHDVMLDWTFSTGLELIWLGTEPGTRAERFYRAAGWSYVGPWHGEAKYEFTRQAWLSRHVLPKA